MQKNKEAVIHFTKIARDRFQIYDFRNKSNTMANTRDLANYLINLRGGQTLDNSFYSKLISMPNFSTIAISKDALNITKKASSAKLEPWKLEKTADGEVFVSAIEDIDEESEDIKKCASLNVKHKYVVSITAKDEDQKIRTYASIKKSACISESCIVITPVNDYVNFDYESEKAPYDVIEEIIGLLANAGLVIDPKQVECCHDFCDCGMDQVGPVVPCENNEFILDCYDQKPIIGQSVESLKSYAEAHDRKHFKIYAYDKVVFDSDAVIKVKAEDNNKSIFTLYLYSDTDNFVESRDYSTFKEAADSFLQIQKEMGERKTDPVLINYMKIKETTDNGEKVLKSWEGADPGNLIPSEAEAVVETETKEETATNTPAPLPTSEAKKEVEEKVETPEGQELEDKVEETVKASAKGGLVKEAEEEKINFEKDLMEAGESKGKKYKVDEEQLEMGKEVEKEHTTNPEIAEKITRDHLKEMPDYYTHLKEMEKGVEKKAEEENLESFDYLYSQLVNGNITEYKQGVNKLFQEGPAKLMEYMDWLEEHNIDTKEALKVMKNASVNKEAETNADPKVVIDKLEKGDLLPGTAERKEGLEKIVNDKEYNEEVKELKDKGAITEEEIKEVKKEDIDKKADGVDDLLNNNDVDAAITLIANQEYPITGRKFFEVLALASKDMDKLKQSLSTYSSEEYEQRILKMLKVKPMNKESKVVKQDGKYQAQSEKGKNFGTYDTKQEAEERVKQMEMFKHMGKKADEETDMIDELYLYTTNNGDIYRSTIQPIIKNLAKHKVSGNYSDDLAIKGMTYAVVEGMKQYAKEFMPESMWFNLLSTEDRAEVAKQMLDHYQDEIDDTVAEITKDAETNSNINKEADKVLVDKNTNEVIKPGESTEGKELKEVEVEKSTTTASNAVYNLFMKSAKINVNAQELRLLTAAYNSNLFKKVAYFGPTAFSFADKHATFIVENGIATCHKTADLTEVEIDKAIKEDPKPATKNEAEDFIRELNKELEVK